jgi:2-polyprenyl-3-methyl-5-hydroxy-6-metoxy-1,4-benzoquinol methylase
MTTAADALYAAKQADYSTRPREELLNLIPRPVARLLDVGCAGGATAALAKARGIANYVSAIDIGPIDQQLIGPHGIDRFLRADVESITASELGGEHDVILCGDVLEHLVDPWAAVAKLATSLRTGGCIIASVPNIRNFRILAQIVFRGDFRYQPAGILDQTHLRFFCRQNLFDLFTAAGLHIDTVGANMGAYGLRHRLIVAASLGTLRDFFVFQHLVRARKP